MTNKNDYKKLSNVETENISGGGAKERVISGALGVAALIGANSGSFVYAQNKSEALMPSLSISKNILSSDISKRQTEIINFLKEEKISETQLKAFKITNEFIKNINKDHRNATFELSSDRYDKCAVATDLEKILDEGVEKGDLPINSFSISDLQSTKSKIKPTIRKDAKFVYYTNENVLYLHEKKDFESGSIVNLASQFNALESVSTSPSAVKWWPYDHTQGPYCALQSVAASKHREAAHIKKKLEDALKGALEKCKVEGIGGKLISITEKYPQLYRNGYLSMVAIKSKKDMKKFLSFLNSNELMDNMKVLSQWVKCEGTGKNQLQFFTAAPSFQHYDKTIWNNNNDMTNMYKQACVRLISLQYKALAQAAAIRSVATGKNVKIYVTMVGHGVFNNPQETISAALKALKEEADGFDVTVCLTVRPKDPNPWKKFVENLNINIMK